MKRYLPLIMLVLVTFLEALTLTKTFEVSLFHGMHFFMGLFFCHFALLKLFHPAKFADGFKMYDIVAQNVKGYAYVYPYMELILGLGYLSFSYYTFFYTATVILMFVSALGVISALKKGLNVKCACMGNILDVPLSTVTLAEDLIMGTMAFLMFFS